jgi:hypothetical protein
VYIPIWLLNVVLMIAAIWKLGASALRSSEAQTTLLAGAGTLLFLPVCLLSILFGMGAPPDTMKEWIDTAIEQKARFDILLADGILVALGLSMLRLLVNEKGEKVYSQLGYTAIVIAIPLFFINTSFWHSYALGTFKLRVADPAKKPLDWYAPAVQQIWIITIGQLVLTYFAIAMFAGSLVRTRIFRKGAAGAYIVISIIAILAILCFPLYPNATAFSGFPYYPFMIPAVPIMLCYYMGINLVQRAGAAHFSIHPPYTYPGQG